MTAARCPSCGYTEADAKFHMDHGRCKNAGNAPWEKKSTPEPAKTTAVDDRCLCRHWFPAPEDREKCPLHSSMVRPKGHNYWDGSRCEWKKSPVWPSQKPLNDPTETTAVDDARVMRIWRECGLPEYFLGNGGTNDKLVKFADAIDEDDNTNVRQVAREIRLQDEQRIAELEAQLRQAKNENSRLWEANRKVEEDWQKGFDDATGNQATTIGKLQREVGDLACNLTQAESQLRQEREALSIEREAHHNTAMHCHEQAGQVAQLQTTVGQQWVSVKDRMPRTGEPCWIVWAESVQLIAYRRVLVWVSLCSEGYAWYSAFDIEADSIPDEQVTHWQPLPEKPDAALATCPAPAKEE